MSLTTSEIKKSPKTSLREGLFEAIVINLTQIRSLGFLMVLNGR